MNFPFEEIFEKCKEFGITPDEVCKERLNTYATLLIEWNEKMNLTAIVDPREVVYKHFYDCMLFLKNIDIPKNAKVVDVGTGAGFPGMVLKIMRPDINLTLLDSLNKRLIFLEEVLNKTNLTATLLHSRAEDAGRNELYRDSFDIACARAVASLNALCEYCLPLVKKGGIFVSMKGPSAGEEIEAAKNALKLCSGEIKEVKKETLTGEEERNFIIINKISQTSPKYPRMGKKITKQPL